jgi:hypothetical protein
MFENTDQMSLNDIDQFGFWVLGLTCRFCPYGELIIAHQDELELQLTNNFLSIALEVIGNNYLVLGTVDMNKPNPDEREPKRQND